MRELVFQPEDVCTKLGHDPGYKYMLVVGTMMRSAGRRGFIQWLVSPQSPGR